jgi:hypothetical protein
VAYADYKNLTLEHQEEMRAHHFVSLKAENINWRSFLHVTRCDHHFEVTRILKSRHAKEFSKKIETSFMHVTDRITNRQDRENNSLA